MSGLAYNEGVVTDLRRTITIGRTEMPVWWELTAKACDKAALARELRRLADQLDAEPEVTLNDLEWRPRPAGGVR